MKIAWVQDLDPFVEGGGAELTDRAYITAGVAQGHTVRLITPANQDEILQPYDLVLMSNTFTFGTKFYESFQEGTPYVLFPHDYISVCKWRLFYPMEERCKDQCYLRNRWRPVLRRAKAFIWLSPLHRRAWLWAYPELRQSQYLLTPPMVDESQFYDLGGERSGALVVNGMVAFKGARRIAEWAKGHPDVPIDVIGPVEAGSTPENIHPVGRLFPNHEMNAVYNKYTTLIHLPATAQPGERVVLEAYLAGCELIVNPLVGVLSYPWFRKGREAIRETLRGAPERFWAYVEALV